MRTIIGFFVCLFSAAASSQQVTVKRFNIELCSEMVEYQGEVYFCGVHHRLGRELFRSNGSSDGTFVVSDIDKGPSSSDPSHFFILRDRLYFFAETALLGKELWRTDGTAEGTKLIKDTVAGPASPELGQYVVNGSNVAYFETPNDVWRTDGSSDGTIILTEVRPDGFMAPLDEFLVYTSETELGKSHLRKIKESSTLSELITDFNDNCLRVSVPYTRNQGGDNLLNNNLRFYSWCGDRTDQFPSSATILTDGTKQGTRVLSEVYVRYLGKKGVQHFFQTDQNGSLFITDGVFSQTIDFCSQAFSCEGIAYDKLAGWVSDKLLYVMRYKGFEELWSTDGTLEGTKKLIRGIIFDFAALGSTTVFTRLDRNGVSKRTLYATTGTPESIVLLKDFGDQKDIEGGSVMGDKYYFVIRENLGYNRSRTELWQTNGTKSGTKKFLDLDTFRYLQFEFKEGGRLYFNSGSVIWHTDGSIGNSYSLTYEGLAIVPALGTKGNLVALIHYLLFADERPKE